MKLQTKSYIFLLLFFFISCGTRKTIIQYKDRVTKDTIIQTKTIKEIERFTDTLTIDKPCDSLGNLKPFKQLIKVKQGNISLIGLNNVITAEIELKGYKDILEKTYKSKYDRFLTKYNKEFVRYKTPLWSWLIHIISALIIFILIRFR